MTFWAYILHCRGGLFYTGHTDNLDRRIAQHESGEVAGFTADRRPVSLVWSECFSTRLEALEVERRIKGWSRAKKMALIRSDWDEISVLSTNRSPKTVRAEPVEAPSYPSSQKEEQPFDKLRTSGTDIELIPHPGSDVKVVSSITVDLRRSGHGLALGYRLTGDTSALVLPTKTEAGRADDLWQTTCFELFLRGDGPAYREYNFSPSGEWAAYAFDSYREGRRDIPAEIAIATDGNAESMNVTASLATDLTNITRLALTAVIEERDGHKSYWAIAHHAGPPDFHHDACFVLPLADIGAA